MRRTPRQTAARIQGAWLPAASRVTLALIFGLSVLIPTLGRVAPVAAQASTVSFSTAEAAPADSLAYLVMTLDEESEQVRLADVLLDRAGLGEVIDEEIGNELRDEAGEDLPLDAFLGGEVGVIVNPTVLDMLAAESMGAGNFEDMLGGIDDTASPEAAVERAGAPGVRRCPPGAGARYGVGWHQGFDSRRTKRRIHL